MISITNLRFTLITGATSGIGYHLARLFALDKYGIILVSRTESDLNKISEEFILKYHCPQVVVIQKDLSKSNSALELYREIKDKYYFNC